MGPQKNILNKWACVNPPPDLNREILFGCFWACRQIDAGLRQNAWFPMFLRHPCGTKTVWPVSTVSQGRTLDLGNIGIPQTWPSQWHTRATSRNTSGTQGHTSGTPPRSGTTSRSSCLNQRSRKATKNSLWARKLRTRGKRSSRKSVAATPLRHHVSQGCRRNMGNHRFRCGGLPKLEDWKESPKIIIPFFNYGLV